MHCLHSMVAEREGRKGGERGRHCTLLAGLDGATLHGGSSPSLCRHQGTHSMPRNAAYLAFTLRFFNSVLTIQLPPRLPALLLLLPGHRR